MSLVKDSLQVWDEITQIQNNADVINTKVNEYDPNIQKTNIAEPIEYYGDIFNAKPIDNLRVWRNTKGTQKQLQLSLLYDKQVTLFTSVNLINDKKDINYYKNSHHSETQCSLYVKRGVKHIEDGFDGAIQPVSDLARVVVTDLNNTIKKTQSGCSLLMGYDKYGIFSWDDVIMYRDASELSVFYTEEEKYKYLQDPYHPTQIDDNLEVY